MKMKTTTTTTTSTTSETNNSDEHLPEWHDITRMERLP